MSSSRRAADAVLRSWQAGGGQRRATVPSVSLWGLAHAANPGAVILLLHHVCSALHHNPPTGSPGSCSKGLGGGRRQAAGGAHRVAVAAQAELALLRRQQGLRHKLGPHQPLLLPLL